MRYLFDLMVYEEVFLVKINANLKYIQGVTEKKRYVKEEPNKPSDIFNADKCNDGENHMSSTRRNVISYFHIRKGGR